METWVLGVAMAVLTVVLATLMWMKSKSGGDRSGDARPRGRPVPQAPVVAGQRARRMNRRTPTAAQRRDADAEQHDDNREDDGDAGSSDESDEGGAKKLEGKMGKKKMEKMQLKAEKKAAREADEREREEMKKRKQKEDEDDKKRRDREEEDEKKKEEEERLRREEKERREHEEYLKMKEAFSVEEEGCQEEDVADKESALKQFIDYIKATKVVVLEDLAAHFRMKTQDVIDRVTALQQEGELSGVIDDRGKFIFISQAELEAVAKFIRQRGRVSIAELAECSNSLINLKPEVPA